MIQTRSGGLFDRLLTKLQIKHERTIKAQNWGQLAMLLTAELRLQNITTSEVDEARASFLLELMQRSGEAEPAAVLAYLIAGDDSTSTDVIAYWGALYQCGKVQSAEAAELAESLGLFEEVQHDGGH